MINELKALANKFEGTEFADRLNDNCMTFTDEELQNLTESIINNVADIKEAIKWNW